MPPRYSTTTPDVAQVIAPDAARRARRRAGLRRRSGSPCATLARLDRRGDRPRRCPAGLAGTRRRRWRWPDQHDRLCPRAGTRRPEREHPPLAVPVLERDRVLLPADHGSAELAGARPRRPARSSASTCGSSRGVPRWLAARPARRRRIACSASAVRRRRSAVHDSGVVAEVHPAGRQAVHPRKDSRQATRSAACPGGSFARPAGCRRTAPWCRRRRRSAPRRSRPRRSTSTD